MTYYNQLRDFVMENDEECKKDLNFEKLGEGIYGFERRDLTINHILAYCQKHKSTQISIYLDCIDLHGTDHQEPVTLNIDFLKPLSEQETVCEQILYFLKG